MEDTRCSFSEFFFFLTENIISILT